MALNPFFLQGSPGEQRLVQELINEQLKIYGVEVTYIPRKFVRKQTVIEEIQSSRFDDNFLLEAYVNTYDGYGGAGDILTKFGMSIRDELVITISRERFEDFIAPFLNDMNDDEIELATRPREGDLVYFPLGQRLFEVKFVEHEQPFYQLGKNYVYELKCELFEYEDEVLDTSVEEVDTVLKEQGYIVDLQLFASGTQATATSTLGTGYIRNITLLNDGSGYTGTPVVSISTAPSGGTNASAVAITTTRNGVTSIGYTTPPSIIITGGGGSGAAATCGVVTERKGVISFTITNGGVGYSTVPNVSLSLPALSPNLPATARAVVSAGGSITEIRIANAGEGFFTAPSVTIGVAATVGVGTYWFNETVTGARSGASARVKNWDKDTSILQVGITTGGFYPGELITGTKSGAIYTIKVSAGSTVDKYEQNDQIESAADLVLDFSESNPFGSY
jgi:hypothetical protein